MSMFDPKTFAQMTFSEANSTESVPVPVGEYPATVDSYEIKEWKKKDDPSQGGLKIAVSWSVDDESVKAFLGRPKVLVRQEFLLDLTDENMLDFGKGKNVTLGRLREAINLNQAGQPWSFDMFVGRQAKVAVKHRQDNRDPNIIYAEVAGVTRL